MMVRVLALVLYAHDDLAFGRGLSTQDEPDLWQKDLTGSIDLWIDVGQPEERDLRRACGRARRVIVVRYGSRGADLWWAQNRDKLERLRNLTVISLPTSATQALARLANRTMRLQCTVQEGLVSVIAGAEMVQLEPVTLLAPAGVR
jgi:uncharacterized protein YaeQ